jgi:chaperone modulatory protein CbpM
MNQKELSGLLLDEQTELTLHDLCRACASSAEWIEDLVDQGILEPVATRRTQWRFSAESLQKARVAMHLQTDLGVNLEGVALVLDLLEEIDALERRLCRVGRDF